MPPLSPEVRNRTHTLQDVYEGRYPCGVEGDGGNDIIKAKALGMFTCNVNGIDIYAKCEADARPLVQYLEQGGEYGSLEFSRLMGYSEDEVQQYAQDILKDEERPGKLRLIAARLMVQCVF